MKKKIIKCSMLAIVFLFLLTGCGKTNNTISDVNEENKTIENTKDKLIISGYDLTLNENSSFSKIKFKYPHDAIISNPITSLLVEYKKKDSDEYLFRVLMGEMYGTNIDDSMQGFTKEGTKTINGIEWSIYSANGRKSYGFNIKYSNIVIGFVYDDPNLSQFEEEFMNNVSLIEQ